MLLAIQYLPPWCGLGLALVRAGLWLLPQKAAAGGGLRGVVQLVVLCFGYWAIWRAALGAGSYVLHKPLGPLNVLF